MKLGTLSLALIGGGIVLMAAALMLPRVVGGEAALSDEVVDQLVDSGKLHEALEHPEKDPQAAEKAREQIQELTAKRDAAQHRGQTTAAVLKWLGIVAAGAGLIVFLVERSQA